MKIAIIGDVSHRVSDQIKLAGRIKKIVNHDFFYFIAL
jgi:hypothetical protein